MFSSIAKILQPGGLYLRSNQRADIQFEITNDQVDYLHFIFLRVVELAVWERTQAQLRPNYFKVPALEGLLFIESFFIHWPFPNLKISHINPH